ncbi:MAG: hypothetical protein EBZ48_17675, partial [Proteobacteria bacterium]|nr:hypothetical protein [Pseudomonadota bacterium]
MEHQQDRGAGREDSRFLDGKSFRANGLMYPLYEVSLEQLQKGRGKVRLEGERLAIRVHIGGGMRAVYSFELSSSGGLARASATQMELRGYKEMVLKGPVTLGVDEATEIQRSFNVGGERAVARFLRNPWDRIRDPRLQWELFSHMSLPPIVGPVPKFTPILPQNKYNSPPKPFNLPFKVHGEQDGGDELRGSFGTFKKNDLKGSEGAGEGDQQESGTYSLFPAGKLSDYVDEGFYSTDGRIAIALSLLPGKH